MLTNIYIQNIILIDVIDVDLNSGFCVLTGETGAGKSILLDSLGIAIGKRASSSLVRNGCTKGLVSATFSLEKSNKVFDILLKQDIDFDNQIILRRVVYKDGKSKAYINDTPVSIGLLQNVAKNLIEINGQNDQGELLETKNHITLLDKYSNISPQLENLAKQFANYHELKSQLQNAIDLQKSSKNDEEYFKFIVNEIEEINPEIGLEEKLSEQRNLLVNKEKIINSISESINVLDGGPLIGMINKCASSLEEVAEFNPNLKKISDLLNSAAIDIDEAISELNAEISNINSDSDDLDQIEGRLFSLRAIAKKHSITSEELVNFKEEIQTKLQNITNSDQIIKDLKDRLSEQKNIFLKIAKDISKKRASAAVKFEKEIAIELKPLKMENTAIKVDICEKPEDQWSARGIDKVEFLVRTNPTSNFGSIKKIASGGELSRLMLTIKLILSNFNTIPTIIFDEIDTGTGGSVSESIGKRLAKLGKFIQVFAITHLPQVASKGDKNYKVVKAEDSEGIISTNLTPLNNEQKLEEVARMIAGDKITNEARLAAKSLINNK